MYHDDEELLHGGKWSEEAKQRVRDARARGIKLMDVNAREAMKRAAEFKARVARNARMAGKNIGTLRRNAGITLNRARLNANRFSRNAGARLNRASKGFNKFKKQAGVSLNRFSKQAGARLNKASKGFNKFKKDTGKKLAKINRQAKMAVLSKVDSYAGPNNKHIKRAVRRIDKNTGNLKSKRSRLQEKQFLNEWNKSDLRDSNLSAREKAAQGSVLGTRGSKIQRQLDKLNKKIYNKSIDSVHWGDMAGAVASTAAAKAKKKIKKGLKKIDGKVTDYINKKAHEKDGKTTTKAERMKKREIISTALNRAEEQRKRIRNSTFDYMPIPDSVKKAAMKLSPKLKAKYDKNDKLADKYRDKELAKAHRRAEEAVNPTKRYDSVGDFLDKKKKKLVKSAKKAMSDVQSEYELYKIGQSGMDKTAKENYKQRRRAEKGLEKAKKFKKVPRKKTTKTKSKHGTTTTTYSFK